MSTEAGYEHVDNGGGDGGVVVVLMMMMIMMMKTMSMMMMMSMVFSSLRWFWLKMMKLKYPQILAPVCNVWFLKRFKKKKKFWLGGGGTPYIRALHRFHPNLQRLWQRGVLTLAHVYTRNYHPPPKFKSSQYFLTNCTVYLTNFACKFYFHIRAKLWAPPAPLVLLMLLVRLITSENYLIQNGKCN